jgi:RNA-directed DNA polymerase
MKRETALIEKVADMENLRLAYWKARKGKEGKKEVITFVEDLDRNLLSLRTQLLCGNVAVGDYKYFTIYDPKERKICAASFSERVLHHALMNVCHANIEKYQVFHSYASRIGKGTFAAVKQAVLYQKQYRWFLKLDVRKYFDSIDQSTLMSLLKRRFKDQLLLQIFSKIIGSYETVPGKGLPIGNLTSQYFANHYLACADHYLLEKLRPAAYIRYMDDMVIWDNDKNRLLQIGKLFKQFIANVLLLHLKPFCLNRSEKGLPFCGFLLYPSKIRLNQNSRKRFASKIKCYWRYLETGEWSQSEFQLHVTPLLAFTKQASSHGFRKGIVLNMTG